jgi:transaldolase
MVEYGIKTVTTNPTLITKSNEIIKLIDTRSNKTRAFVLPATYEPLIEKLVKDIEDRKWAKDKKNIFIKTKLKKDDLSDIMEAGWEDINNYLEKTDVKG